MSPARIMLTLLGAVALAAAASPAEGPAFPYDTSKTPLYLGQTLRISSSASATGLRQELSNVVEEILDGPWLPLYSDYSAGEAGGVGVAEWCFNRPGEYLLALSQAAPYMAPPQRERVREFLRNLVKTSPPTRQVQMTIKSGKPRNLRQSPAPPNPWRSEADIQRRGFAEAYAIWAYASAFEAWGELQPLFEDLRRLRAPLEARGDFAPAYKPDCAGPCTAADTRDPEYRFRVYQALLAGFQDNYWYHGAREARDRMQKDKPVFFHVQTLAALLGYHRLAQHYGQSVEAEWARQTFDKVAALTLEEKSAPYLWSDPALCPEVARLMREAAGPWLDELARTTNVGNLPALDWNHKVVSGRRDYYVMNPYTWYHAWGGQGEGVRPRTVLGAFLVHAYLFNAPAPRIAETLDIPWCKADLYFAQKLVVAIQAAEKTTWAPAK